MPEDPKVLAEKQAKSAEISTDLQELLKRYSDVGVEPLLIMSALAITAAWFVRSQANPIAALLRFDRMVRSALDTFLHRDREKKGSN